MGRKAIVTQKDVFDAADTLVAEGKPVSAATLLTALGGGSFTTIYKHLAAWHESKPAAHGAQTTGEMPDAAKMAFSAAWRTAASEAARELATLREKAADEVKAARKEFQEALATIDRLESENEADTIRIEDFSKQVATLEVTLRESETERAALVATTEQQRQRLETSQAELERLRVERDTAMKEAAELHGQAESMKAQNSDLLSRLTAENQKRRGQSK